MKFLKPQRFYKKPITKPQTGRKDNNSNDSEPAPRTGSLIVRNSSTTPGRVPKEQQSWVRTRTAELGNGGEIKTLKVENPKLGKNSQREHNNKSDLFQILKSIDIKGSGLKSSKKNKYFSLD